MRTWNRILNSVMICSASVTVVRFIVDCIDLTVLRPEVYLAQSAPWYTAGLLYSAITLVLWLVCAVIKAITKRKAGKPD